MNKVGFEKDSVRLFLREDIIRNLSITGFMEENPVSSIYRAGNSLAVKGKSDREWIYFSSKNENEFRELLFLIDKKVKNFGSLDEWMIPILYESNESEWVLPALSYYLPETVTIPEAAVTTKRLAIPDASSIIRQSKYSQFLSEEYLGDRINRSFSAGIEINGSLAAWGLTHDDGALGSIHVIDKYRGKGFGKEIVISLVKQCRQRGKIPFAQIEEDNIPSIRLFEKLGFVKDRTIAWMKLR